MSPKFEKTEWFEVFQNLFNNWKIIALIAFTVAVITAIVTLFIPNQYKATANLLPNQKTNVGFNLFSEGTGLSSLAGSILGQRADETNRYYTLLNSYTTKKRVVNEFNLIDVYETSDSKYPLIDAMNILENRTRFNAHQTGNFTIEVWDRDPARAKALTDFYVVLLNQLNTEISTREAYAFREFTESRYHATISQIEKIRTDLEKFQKKYGVFQLEDQVIQYFNLIGTITAKQIEAEIRLDYLSKTVLPNNQQYLQTKSELESINTRLASIYQDESNENFILNFSNLSEIGLTYAELVKKLEIQSEVLKFIVPLLEQAKMEEAKALPIVTILDEPVIPEKKDFPPRTIIVILAGFTSIILASSYYTLKLSIHKNKQWFDSLKS
ncbi:MAG: Wzz/FepE/Etk N-terminal domain-containing protein [Balneolaceae bacterium]